MTFELFLGAYAVLGPLHYLTQISWLHTRRYFTTGRRDFMLLLTLGAILAATRYVVTDADPTAWATTVVAVAAAVGYESEAAFSRAFKKCAGMAPAAWRRRTAA